MKAPLNVSRSASGAAQWKLPVPAVVCLAVALAASGSGMLGFVAWPPSADALTLLTLLSIATVNSWLDDERSAGHGGTMPLSFLINLAALIQLGPGAATLVAAIGAVTLGAQSAVLLVLVQVAMVVASTQAAAFVYSSLGGTIGQFEWPAQALPILAAVVAYCIVRAGVVLVIVPTLSGQSPRFRSWGRLVASSLPSYILGACVAVAVVEIIDRRMWGLFVVATLPLYLIHRSYLAHLDRRENDQHQQKILQSLEQGMCAVDDAGRVTEWNEALQNLLSCPPEQALGRTIAQAVPVLGHTEFPRVIGAALAQLKPHAIERLLLPSSDGTRALRVKVLPHSRGATVLWYDTTAGVSLQQALKRSEERLALFEAGTNDGLWEWDVRGQQLYVSERWRALVGLSGAGRSGSPDEWFDRVHPDDLVALKSAIEEHLTQQSGELRHEHRVLHEDGVFRRVLCRAVAQRTENGRCVRIAGSLTDVTEQTAGDKPIETAGSRDPLTGLHNRTVFVEALGRQLHEVKERRTSCFATLYLDLDRFKVVNDSLGHLVGDELLCGVARRLESCLREGDWLARLGGDEFAVLLSGLVDQAQANAVAFRIQEALSASFSIGGREVFTTASIGIAFSGSEYNNPEEIMRDADAAMYHAKASGKARHEVFDADMHKRALDRLVLESDLRVAVKNCDFEVHYQPIVLLVSGACAGFESLVRWRRNGALVPPDKFIPVAEELGLIEPLGTWVLQEACRTFAAWQRRFPDAGLECITVNVSTRQLMDQNFVRLVEQAVSAADLAPAALRLEITETALMGNPYTTAETLRELRDFGVKIYLDDFGTGYSSLGYLHKLPVDALKIDRSFVRSLLLPERPKIVESVLALARTLATGVVAEGVESEVQARELKRLGCRHAQGYLYSPPIPGSEVEQLLGSPRLLGQPATTDSGTAIGTQNVEALYVSQPLVWPDSAHAGATAPLN